MYKDIKFPREVSHHRGIGCLNFPFIFESKAEFLAQLVVEENTGGRLARLLISAP